LDKFTDTVMAFPARCSANTKLLPKVSDAIEDAVTVKADQTDR
jgi:hypothetical protein